MTWYEDSLTRFVVVAAVTPGSEACLVTYESGRRHLFTLITHTTGNLQAMPRKPKPSATRAKRAAEAPIRAARRLLRGRLDQASTAIDRTNGNIASIIYDATFSYFAGTDLSLDLPKLEATLTTQRATFRSRLADLQAFDLLHHVDGAVYPKLVEVDREATMAQAKADLDAAMTRARHSIASRRPPASRSALTN